MTPIEAEAMLIRHTAAMKYIEFVGEAERLEMLALIISPSPEVLNASMAEAERRGVSDLAMKMSRVRVKPRSPAQERTGLRVAA